jgi:NADH-quinone oxidoreductase subunit F
MGKIRSIADLESIKQTALAEINSGKIIIRACNTGCRARKSLNVIKALEDRVAEDGLQDRVVIRKTGCHGFCEMGPILVIEPDNIFYRKVRPEDVTNIISETVLKGNVVERLLWEDPQTKERCRTEKEVPFYSKQKKILSRNCGRIDPADIKSYISASGYAALCKVLTEMTPAETVDTVVASGLRGRSGGGFPAGLKWKICSSAPGNARYIIANGDEGDPGAFMDRSLMEGDPHSIIEGMIIGAYAIGAHEGFIYVREEYPIAIEHLTIALNQAEEYGLLGDDILGSGFALRIYISKGAGAFVCGESTALMHSIEGKRGMPRSRPPNSVYSGLRGKPTVLNNVETFANIPAIIDRGAEWYSGIGTKRSKGSKIFSLVGSVRNTGLVEVEMGTTLQEIIFDIGGGTKGGKSFKAVQTGGPSGGCIPKSKINMPVDLLADVFP